MTSYTNISKPANTPYTNQNSIGKEQYDQVTLSYDDSTTYYDGINDTLYTKILKPAQATGLWQDDGLTWDNSSTSWSSAGTSYTNVAKPT